MYECLWLAKVLFVPGKRFQPSLMFESKAGVYLSEAPKAPVANALSYC
jgi:hypothetical protein